ncbi:MAG: isochorismatase family protein [Gammaproteobacteria bacterium]|nr:isochorismatase family protein [Gammaproteobacteria bacterium]
MNPAPTTGDALIVVDVQKDFLPGGRLAVPHGDEVIPVLNRYISLFQGRGLPVFLTRDWHPPEHCSFQSRGGPWPSHCVAATAGAEFASTLDIPTGTPVISKGTERGKDAYSGFEGTDLDRRLEKLGVSRVFVGGLATDYCVLNTVRDALAGGLRVVLLRDACRAVNVQARDGVRAEREMERLGALPAEFAVVSAH